MTCSAPLHQNLIILLYIDGLLDCFQIFLTINKLDGNIYVQVSVYRWFLFSRLHFCSGMAGSMVNVSKMMKEIVELLFQVAITVCKPVLTNTWHCQYFSPSCSYSKRCALEANGVLTCKSLMLNFFSFAN